VGTSVVGLNTRELSLDLLKIRARYRNEGIGFLTKTLPNLGKALDSALLGQPSFDNLRCRKVPGTKLPKLFGELFKRVFSPDGTVLNEPCIRSIRALRDLCFIYYKYEIPFTQTQSATVITAFEQTEKELSELNLLVVQAANSILCNDRDHKGNLRSQDGLAGTHRPRFEDDDLVRLIRAMRREGHKFFSSLDLSNIRPKHGPGVVSTGESNEEKYTFKRYSSRIDSVYPYSSYFYAAEGHLEHPDQLDQLSVTVPSARVLLVPKDSRGPRLISCEPLENQWIQQGIKQSLVEFIEAHPVMGGHVNFTDQSINRDLALLGSVEGEYATLDLKEASDRISYPLVQLIYPHLMVRAMSVCRTNSTQLPDGRLITLSKFAPMGSALCFPVLAITVWLALTAGDDACSRKTTYVYGDDIIVHRTDVHRAIKRLELVGLKVNVHKSCFTGFFRESCGCDAYKGHCITPLRLRKVWSHRPQSDLYVSYIAKANEAYDRGYPTLASYLARLVASVYKEVPYNTDGCLTCYEALSGAPHLTFIPVVPNYEYESLIPPQGRFVYSSNTWRCKSLRQKTCRKTQRVLKQVTMLKPLRVISVNQYANYFRALARVPGITGIKVIRNPTSRRIELHIVEPGRSEQYTHKQASKLVRKWR
jgi:hypothetical protein